MPVRALIVDDEPAARAALRALLRGDADVTVVGECRNGREALSALQAGNIDLVFLDVQMPEIDGFSVVEQLDPRSLPAIVFVTAYDQYALRAFSVHAVDYLVKPFTDERFFDTLRHVKQQIARGQSHELATRLTRLLQDTTRSRVPEAAARDYLRRLPIQSGERVVLLPVGDIDWIAADGDYARIHVGSAEYLIREPLSHLADSLDPTHFARIHRSTIVNLDRIRELRPLFKGDHLVQLRDGTELKLSRHFKRPLEQMLGRPL
jgi:two-component system, LytTR family, response regulator